ncbi:putative reverse transcriptase/RNA-dependent DNA polymerase [Citrus sinensis]|uniref:Reverse transcriptase/RNA-dependent DNA polymerase n=1 Tax=Citrus sinensis TaxID=2711 RepID=A0ACB8J3Q8_CITSI|nr:putative reverse transcriptase/RNA-dependent DNA polymerase [Citrus sinensis]
MLIIGSPRVNNRISYALSLQTIGFHALVTCKTARKVWRLTQFAEELKEEAGKDLLSLLNGRLSSRRKADTEMLVAICWGIWSARNQFIFKLKKEDPQIVLAKAEAILKAYKRTHMPASIHMDQQTRMLQQSWTPPPAGCYKLNVDAATNRDKQISGLGAVIRNAEGNVVAAAINFSKFFGDVAYVEAAAMEFGLQVAGNANLPSLIVETDSQEVAGFVNNRQSSMTEIWWVVAAIQSLMKNFNQIKVQHIPRSCNTIAHSLTKLALEKCENVKCCLGSD